MAWEPQPASQPRPGRWVELEFDRWVAGVAAEVRAKEQARRLRQLRRRVERIDEQLCLAEGAEEARRHLRRQGFTYERSVRSRDGDLAESWRPGEVEHSHHAGSRILSVRW
jgi:hypothetical protein